MGGVEDGHACAGAEGEPRPGRPEVGMQVHGEPPNGSARLEIRVAERVCSLWALLAAAPGVLVLEDVLVLAFRLFVSTGAVEPRASIFNFNMPHGLGISVPALLEALRWRYPGETSACRCWCRHCSEGANVYLLHSLLAPLWHGGPILARQGSTHMPGWDQAPHRRLVLVEGYVAGIVSAEWGHVVGLNSRGYIFCSRLADLRTGRDIHEAVELVLGRVGRVWQVWCVLLPREEAACRSRGL